MNSLGEFGRLAAAQEKRYRPRHTVQRQIAGHFVTVLGESNRGAFERDAGKLLRIEEIGATQMIVAFAVIGVDAVSLGCQLERAIGRVLTIERKLAGKVVESALNPRQSEMRNLKADSSMRGVDRVSLGLLRDGCRAQGGQNADDQTGPKLRSHGEIPGMSGF